MTFRFNSTTDTGAPQAKRSKTLILGMMPLLIALGSCTTMQTAQHKTLDEHLNTHHAALSGADKDKKRVLAEHLAENPDMLAELTSEEARLVLAKPVLERRESNNIALQFKSPSCVVDVFYALPLDATDEQAERQYKPSHVDMRDVDGRPKADEAQKRDCVRSFL